jgi:hypothetical protein
MPQTASGAAARPPVYVHDHAALSTAGIRGAVDGQYARRSTSDTRGCRRAIRAAVDERYAALSTSDTRAANGVVRVVLIVNRFTIAVR